MALSQQRAAITRGQTELDIEAQRRDQRHKTVEAATAALREALKEDERLTPRDLIALRFVEYLEQRIKDQDGNGIDSIDSLAELQSLEALEAMRHK